MAFWSMIIAAGRKFLLKTCAVGILLGLIVAFSIPKEYETSVFTVPESRTYTIMDEESPIEGFTSGKQMRDAILPSFYPLVVRSTPFLTSLFDVPVTPYNKEIGTLTLYEYMEKHQRRPWWSAVKSFPFKVVGFAISLFKEKETIDSQNPDKPLDPFQLTRREAAVAGALRRRIKVDVDVKRRTITLNVRMQDPVVAAVVADSVSAYLQEYITDYRRQKEYKNLEHVEEVHKQAYEEYCRTQETYARFYDKNQDLALKTAQGGLRKLAIEKELAYNYYSKTARQLQQAKKRAYRERPVYAVVEPAKVPHKPVAPQKGIIVVVCIFLSVIVAYGWLWIKNRR